MQCCGPERSDLEGCAGRLTSVSVKIVVEVALGLLLTYAVLVAALVLVRPDQSVLREAARLLPDLLRLVRRLASDRVMSRGTRAALWLLLAYLAMPFDLVPDFVPVIGYADDAVLVAVILRWIVRRAGPEKIEHHWQGTPDGLRAVKRLAGVNAR